MRENLARIILLLFLLFLTFGCTPAEEPAEREVHPAAPSAPEVEPTASEVTLRNGGPLQFRQLEPGLELFQGNVTTIGGQSVSLDLVRVNTHQHPIKVVSSLHRKSAGHTILAYQEQHNAKVVLSGGFLKSFHPALPLGLVKSGGTLLNRPIFESDLLNGLLIIRSPNRRPDIVPFQWSERRIAGWADALQSGPLLVRRGRAVIFDISWRLASERKLVEQYYTRAFIAIDQSGHFLLAITGKVSLPLLVDLLIRPASEGGLGCMDALNLSGGGSEGLVLKVGERDLALRTTDVRLPNAIVVQ